MSTPSFWHLQPLPIKPTFDQMVNENGDQEDKSQEDMTEEAKKIVETLTGTNSQTCKLAPSDFLILSIISVTETSRQVIGIWQCFPSVTFNL